jgi:cytochrome c556
MSTAAVSDRWPKKAEKLSVCADSRAKLHRRWRIPGVCVTPNALATWRRDVLAVNHRNGLLRTLMTAGAVLTAGAVVAAGLSGADALKDRQAHMKEMGKAAKAIGDSLKAGSADPTVIKPNADKIYTNSKTLLTWFPKGSGPETGLKTRALPVIWTDTQDFQAKAHDLQVAAANFDAVAGSGDMAKVGPAVKALGQACHACHEKFQAKEKED